MEDISELPSCLDNRLKCVLWYNLEAMENFFDSSNVILKTCKWIARRFMVCLGLIIGFSKYGMTSFFVLHRAWHFVNRSATVHSSYSLRIDNFLRPAQTMLRCAGQTSII